MLMTAATIKHKYNSTAFKQKEPRRESKDKQPNGTEELLNALSDLSEMQEKGRAQAARQRAHARRLDRAGGRAGRGRAA